MKLWLMDLHYTVTDGQTYMILWGRDEKDWKVQKVMVPHDPWFYCELEPDEHYSIVKKERTTGEINGRMKDVWKVYCQEPFDVATIARGEVESGNYCWNYNIFFTEVFCRDHQVSTCSWMELELTGESIRGVPVGLSPRPITGSDVNLDDLNIMSWDMEMFNPPYLSYSEYPIIIITVSTNYSDERNHTLVNTSGEAILIQDFVELFEELDPDMMMTYNGHDFDYPKLMERAERYGIRLPFGRDGSQPRTINNGAIQINGRMNPDVFGWGQFVKTKAGTQGLKVVAPELLGVVDHGIEGRDIWKYWMNLEGYTREELIAYAIDDAIWTQELGLNFMLHEMIALSKTIGMKLTVAPNLSKGYRVEQMLIYKSGPRNWLIPKAGPAKTYNVSSGGGKWGKKRESYKGALVLDPPYGLFTEDDVPISIIDFRSMYVNLMIKYNIGPDTFNPKGDIGVPECVHRYISIRESLYTECLRELLELRESSKNKFEGENYKTLGNSFYGYLGWVGAKFFRLEIAESVTGAGRNATRGIVGLAEEIGMEVLYGHTDSIFIPHVGDDVDEMFCELVEERLGLEVKVDDVFVRSLFTGAKNVYAGAGKDGSVTVKGFPCIRRSGLNFSKRLQRELLDLVLLDGADAESAREYASYKLNELREGHITITDLVFRVGYGTESLKTPQGMIADRKGYPLGRMVEYLIIDGIGNQSSRAREPEEMKRGEFLDMAFYVKNALNLIMMVLGPMGVQGSEVLSGRKQLSFGDVA